MSALALMAAHEHKHVKVSADDVVIISAHAIPGNEVERRHGSSTRCTAPGPRCCTSARRAVHVSGHASQEELKFMLDLVRPEWFVPVHGEYRHMVHHARLAEAVGVPVDRVLVCEDGDVVTLEGGDVDVERRAVPAGYQYVDGIVGDVDQGVLRDRRNLAEEGIRRRDRDGRLRHRRDRDRSGDRHPRAGCTRRRPPSCSRTRRKRSARRSRKRRPRVRPTSRRSAATRARRWGGSSPSARAVAPRSSRSSWRSDRVRGLRMIRDWSNFIGGRVALVTGSGAGMGRAIAIHMARAGAEVWINDVDLERAQRASSREIEAEGGKAHAVVADVCDPASVREMAGHDRPARHPRQQRGQRRAGVRRPGMPARAVRGVDARRVGARDAGEPHGRAPRDPRYLPDMIERGWGRILTIVSDAGRRGERRQVVYGAAKAAAMGFSRGLAAEVGRSGVTVNCISLGIDEARPAGRGDRRRTPSSSASLSAPIRSAASAGSTTPRRWPCCSAATRPSGSPARCIRSTAATRPRSDGGGRPSRSADAVRRRVLCRAVGAELSSAVGGCPSKTKLVAREGRVSLPARRPAAILGGRAPPAPREPGAPGRPPAAPVDLGPPARRRRPPARWPRCRRGRGRPLVLAALLALGLFSDLAGPVGTGLADGFGTLIGEARYAVPVVCVGFAILLLPRAAGSAARSGRPGREADRADTAGDGSSPSSRARAAARRARAWRSSALAVVGALHLLGGSPAIDGSRRLAA